MRVFKLLKHAVEIVINAVGFDREVVLQLRGDEGVIEEVGEQMNQFQKAEETSGRVFG